ncbi:class I SAM-dependent methyltransferase [Acaryochloris sp. CCMEE 5410]|uniref:class I SAM-dependent methyltransferase n=1 Tax=Acaryochloris sp. CCMEE 5410 TaxID=310037 RepID=UPI0002484D1B|nr:class I SAM-dependent methyltransferase [Acaryochloris sp. CCMEE 5410]KAI9133540.1 class I SAM-dependent methyltransferase [Acaryochloris sp. CCMEE 5410]
MAAKPNVFSNVLSPFAWRSRISRLATVLAGLWVLGTVLWSLIGLNAEALAGVGFTDPALYQEKSGYSLDGIGKVYMGREIAQVMGHQGAGWLERSGRASSEQPRRLVEALNLSPTDVVADIGAGTGYMSFRMTPFLPEGKVLAVDIQPEMVEILNYFKEERQVDNLDAILGNEQNPNLPEQSVDLVLMVDAYHEFEFPNEMMTGIVKALKPGGRVVLAEYRAENPLVMIKPLHKMTQKQVRKEMLKVGLVWKETKNLLPQQHLMFFEAA